MHLMIDLETLGTDVNTAHILELGAVLFDIDKPVLGSRISMFVNGRSNRAAGRYPSLETIQWWLTQDPEVFKKVISPQDSFTLGYVLSCLTKLMQENGEIEGVWSNGATFDVAMLESAYGQCAMPIPWKYSKIMDCRTMLLAEKKALRSGKKAICFKEYVGEGTKHRALSDAILQARRVQEQVATIAEDSTYAIIAE